MQARLPMAVYVGLLLNGIPYSGRARRRPKTELTAALRRSIINAYPDSPQHVIAARYGVDPATVSRILKEAGKR